jgi:hypothetical protein
MRPTVRSRDCVRLRRATLRTTGRHAPVLQCRLIVRDATIEVHGTTSLVSGSVSKCSVITLVPHDGQR